MGGFCLAQDPLPYASKSVALTSHTTSAPTIFRRTNDGQGVLSTPVSWANHQLHLIVPP